MFCTLERIYSRCYIPHWNVRSVAMISAQFSHVLCFMQVKIWNTLSGFCFDSGEDLEHVEWVLFRDVLRAHWRGQGSHLQPEWSSGHLSLTRRNGPSL